MSKIHHVGLLLISSLLLLSNAGNPPNGNTGAPGDGICSNCHSAGSGIDGSISIIGLPSTIDANTTYSITVAVENITGASKGGFQLVALDQNNANIGTFSAAGPNSTLQSSGGRTYFEHNPAQSFTGPGTINYTVSWKSPPNASGQTIKMYAASILSNGNNMSSGDLTKTDIATGMLPGTALSASITSFKNITCNGGNDGSIAVTATNGNPPYSYQWSDGQTTATAIGLTAKLYTVTVSDNNNSMVVLSKLLTEPSAINIVTTGKKKLNCFGDKDGSITVNSSGGTGTHRYQWNTGATTKTIANLTVGTYTVTVFDNLNCNNQETIEITQPDKLSVEKSNLHHPFCAKDSTAGVNIVPDGGTQPYIFKWSSGEISSSIDFKPAGTYTVTVTDKNGCSLTNVSTFIIQDNIRPVFNHWGDSLSYRCNLLAVAPIVTDNCGIKEVQQLEGIQAGKIFPIGTTKMRYKAKDTNNNESEYSYTVTIVNPLHLKVDTVNYDTCIGHIQYVQLHASNSTNQFYELYFNKLKIERYDSIITKKYFDFITTDSIISIKDSFECYADSVLHFKYTEAKLVLDSFQIKDASECDKSDGEIELHLTGNIVYSYWINAVGDTLHFINGSNIPKGKYLFYASTGENGDSTSCIFQFGPFEVKCTTGSNNYSNKLIGIFPNPADQRLKILLTSEELINIRLNDLNGKLMFERKNHFSNEYIDISDVVPGLYFLEVEGVKWKLKQRIIISH